MGGGQSAESILPAKQLSLDEKRKHLAKQNIVPYKKKHNKESDSDYDDEHESTDSDRDLVASE